MRSTAVGPDSSTGRSRGPGPDLHARDRPGPARPVRLGPSAGRRPRPVAAPAPGGKLRLSFSVTTIILGLAAALLLVIGIRAALAPWNDGTRSAGSANQAGSASPAAGAALSSDSDQPHRPLLSRPSSVQLIGNPSKGRYHLSTCPDIQSMNPSNKVLLRDAEAARAAGLQPCARLPPPRWPRPAEGE